MTDAMVRVRIPTPLHSYTKNASQVQAEGDTLAALLLDLDRQFPGFRFRVVDEQDRIREHIRFFVNQEMAADLKMPIKPADEVRIIMAISGG